MVEGSQDVTRERALTNKLFHRYTHLDSFLHRLDARSKIVGFALCVVIVSSVPPERPRAVGYFLPLVLLMVMASRVPVYHVIHRCVAVSPIIVMAALSSAWAGYQDVALSVLIKAYCAVVLLTLLTATTGIADFMAGLRRLGAPESLGMTTGLMIRYIHLLEQEYSRMTRARDSRSVTLSPSKRLRVYGQQIALLFIRSWERAERIHAAMLSRGFSGLLPVLNKTEFGLADAAFLTGSVAVFGAVRIVAS